MNLLAKFSPVWDPGKRQKSKVELHSFQLSSIQWKEIPKKGRVFLLVQASIVNEILPENFYF
jgi:hypothetical protein